MPLLNYHSSQNKKLLLTEAIVAFLIVYIPFEPFLLKFTNDSIYPFLNYATEIIILILFFTVLTAHFLNREKFIKTPIDIPLAVFIAITFISSLVNRAPLFLWIIGLRQIFRYTLLYYIIVYSRFSKEMAKRLVILLLTLLLLQSTIALAQAFIGKRADEFLLPGAKREFAGIVSPAYVYQFWSSGQRVFSTMGRYDRLGTFICFMLILAAGIFYEVKKITDKKKLLALMILPFAALIFTYSRMSWLGFILGLIFINVAVKKNKKFIIVSSVLFLICTVYLFIYVKSNNIKVSSISDNASMTIPSRILSLFSFEELKISYNGYGRLYFFVNTPKKVVSKYPFFGVGFGQYGSGVAYAFQNKKVYDELGLPFGIENRQGQIDNNWMSLWGEGGTLGLIAFIGIILSLFLFSWRLYQTVDDDFIKGIALGFLGIVIAVSFQACLGPYFEVRTLSFYFWLMAGVVVCLGKKDLKFTA
ncbi:MAG: O-antigen ligase family protein [bacterium]